MKILKVLAANLIISLLGHGQDDLTTIGIQPESGDSEVRTINAAKWLNAEVALLQNGWGAKGQYPRGTINVPKNTVFTVDSTLVVPIRVCLRGDELHQPNFSHRSTGFKASDNLPEKKFVIDLEVKQKNRNFNGNFGTHFHNIYSEGNRKSYGVRWGGAQCSSLINFTSLNCSNYNLYIGKASRNLTLQSINLTNFSPDYKRTGTGLYIRGVTNVNLTDLASHSFVTGAHIKASQNVNLVGANFEKVDIPLVIDDGSAMIDVRGVVMEYASHIVIDLTKNKGGTLIKGILKHTPYDTYEAIKYKRPLPVREGVDIDGKPLDPKGVYLKDTNGKLRLITTSTVKHNHRRGFIVETKDFGRQVEIRTP